MLSAVYRQGDGVAVTLSQCRHAEERRCLFQVADELSADQSEGAVRQAQRAPRYRDTRLLERRDGSRSKDFSAFRPQTGL